MVTSCASFNCTNRYQKGSGISFHKFPLHKPELLSKWLVAIKRDKFVPTYSHRLCSIHFTEACFWKSEGNKILKDDAVPTLFDFPDHLRQFHMTSPQGECCRMQPYAGTDEELRLIQRRQKLEMDSLNLRHKEEILAYQMQRRLYLERTRMSPMAEKQAIATSIALGSKYYNNNCTAAPTTTGRPVGHVPEQLCLYNRQNSIFQFVSPSDTKIPPVDHSGEPNTTPSQVGNGTPSGQFRRGRFIVTKVEENDAEVGVQSSARCPHNGANSRSSSSTLYLGQSQHDFLYPVSSMILNGSRQQLYPVVCSPVSLVQFVQHASSHTGIAIPTMQTSNCYGGMGGYYLVQQANIPQQPQPQDSFPPVTLVYSRQQLNSSRSSEQPVDRQPNGNKQQEEKIPEEKPSQ